MCVCLEERHGQAVCGFITSLHEARVPPSTRTQQALSNRASEDSPNTQPRCGPRTNRCACDQLAGNVQTPLPTFREVAQATHIGGAKSGQRSL